MYLRPPPHPNPNPSLARRPARAVRVPMDSTHVNRPASPTQTQAPRVRTLFQRSWACRAGCKVRQAPGHAMSSRRARAAPPIPDALCVSGARPKLQRASARAATIYHVERRTLPPRVRERDGESLIRRQRRHRCSVRVLISSEVGKTREVVSNPERGISIVALYSANLYTRPATFPIRGACARTTAAGRPPPLTAAARQGVIRRDTPRCSLAAVPAPSLPERDARLVHVLGCHGDNGGPVLAHAKRDRDAGAHGQRRYRGRVLVILRGEHHSEPEVDGERE